MKTRPPRSSIMGIVVFLALLLVMTTGLYALARHGTAAILTSDPSADPQERARRMSSLLLGVLLIGVLIIVFVMGAYMVMRAGRSITRQKLGGKETEFRDVWKEARVTPEELAAADKHLREAQGGPDSEDPDSTDPDVSRDG